MNRTTPHNGNGRHYGEDEPAATLPSPRRWQTAVELTDAHHEMRPYLVEGVWRRGEVGSLNSASKARKSWLMMQLAICLAIGGTWLKRFQCYTTNVLVIDAELHPETWACRFREVAEAMGVSLDDVGPRICVHNVRGELLDINNLGPRIFRELERDTFGAVLLDPLYKFWPEGIDENDNAGVTRVMNTLDTYAHQTGAAIVFTHHFAKGNMAGRNLMDLGAGASAMGRSVDVHGGIRPHQDDDCVVLEFETRSSPKMGAIGLRHAHPLTFYDPSIDPMKLRRPGKNGSDVPDEEPEPWTVDRFAATFYGEKGKTKDEIIIAATLSGLSRKLADTLHGAAVGSGKIHRWDFGRARKEQFATGMQPLLPDAPPEKSSKSLKGKGKK